MLILDSTPASITSELMRHDPALCDKFDGFICFENNRAMHEMTIRGVPGLMTGKFLEKDISANDYENTIFGSDSFLYSFVDRNMPVYFTNGMGDGYTNRRVGNFSNEGAGLVRAGPVFARSSKDTPYVSLFDTVKFRLAPYRYKSGILDQAVRRAMRGRTWKNWSNEEFLFSTLAATSLADHTNTALAVFHTGGTHGPISRDRNGRPLAEPTHEPSAFADYAVFLFHNIAAFMDDLRAKGIYDKTLIVFCADHGSIELRQGDGTRGHGAEDSILWVKPIGAKSPFAISSQPTSNCRIADLMKQSLDHNLSADEVAAVLYATERKFRAKFGRAWWSAGRSPYFYEWRYDDTGKVISCENLGVFTAN